VAGADDLAEPDRFEALGRVRLSRRSSFSKIALAMMSEAWAANTVRTRIVVSWNRFTIESLPT
jgi:hypothetical protein